MNSDGKHPGSAPLRDQYQADDEISLVDLALVLLRRKWLIMGILVLCAGLGLAYALSMTGEPSYRYTTVVELGRMEDGKPVESPISVKSFLDETVVPLLRDRLRSEYQDPNKRLPEVDVSIPQGSDRFLQLNSEGIKENYGDIDALHKGIFKEIRNELDEMVLVGKNNLEIQRDNLQSELKRLGIEKERVIERVGNAYDRLQTARALLNQAPSEATDEIRAMTLLTIQAQMEEAHRQLATLEDQLFNIIPDKQDKLNLELAKLNNSLEFISLAQIRVLVRESENPVGGTSKKLILALSLVLGGMLGVFGAFFAEFVGKIKEAANQ